MVILESVAGWSEQGDSSPGIPADSAYTTMQPFPWHDPELETIRIRAFPSVNPVNEVIPATTDSHLTAIRELFEQWLSPRLLNSTATPKSALQRTALLQPDARSNSDCKLVSHDPNWHIKLG